MRTSLTVCAIVLLAQLICVEVAFGQGLKESNITYRVEKTSVSEVFTQLGKITGFNFFYDESVLDGLKDVGIHFQNGSLDTILKALSQQTGLYFKKINNTISVSRQRPIDLGAVVAGQSRILTGRMVDRAGEPVIGANVRVKNREEPEFSTK